MPEKIIIYGAGEYGETFYEFLRFKGIQDRVYCFCDKNAHTMEIPAVIADDGLGIVTFEETADLGLPYVITASRPDAREQIAELIRSDGRDHAVFDSTVEWLKENGVDILEEYKAGLYRCLPKEIMDHLFDTYFRQSRSFETVKRNVSPHLWIERRPVMLDDDGSKIKIRFAHYFPISLNSFQSIAEYFAERSDVDLSCIIGCNCQDHQHWQQDLKKQMHLMNMHYTMHNDYRIEEDRPDIFVFNSGHSSCPYDSVGGFEKLGKYCTYIAVVPFTYINYVDVDNWITYYDCVLRRLRYDALIVQRKLYPILSAHFHDTVCMSNPKFDAIYRNSRYAPQIPDSWKKIAGCRKILWAPSHGAENGYIPAIVSADVYLADVCRYLDTRRDVALIFRPHSQMIDEYLQNGFWSEDDYKRIRRYFDESPNMVWDDSDDYSDAFAISDAMMTDPVCGILYSYLPTKKPILQMFRNSYLIFDFNQDLTKNYYKAYDWDGVRSFIEMVARGEDPMYDARMKTVDEYIPDFDGKCGERIGRFIIEDHLKKYGRKDPKRGGRYTPPANHLMYWKSVPFTEDHPISLHSTHKVFVSRIGVYHRSIKPRRSASPSTPASAAAASPCLFPQGTFARTMR